MTTETKTEPPVAEKPKRRPAEMHEQDAIRLNKLLQGKPMPQKLLDAYFIKQREYHQHMQGPLPLEWLAQLLLDVCKITVYLPDLPQAAEDASDRIASNNRA